MLRFALLSFAPTALPLPPADDPPMTQVVLTDRLLRSWLRCKRRAWLDRHGDPEARRWTAHRSLALSDQLASFQSLLAQKPGRGEAACAAAAPGVVGLRLQGEGPAGLQLQAHPSLLERLPGPSRWGDHAYRPVLGRQGRNLTREHRLLLALWGRLLALRQQAPVPQALVVAGSGRNLQRDTLSLSVTVHFGRTPSPAAIPQVMSMPINTAAVRRFPASSLNDGSSGIRPATATGPVRSTV